LSQYKGKEGEIMPDIIHRVGIKATPKKVFEALSTIDGLSHWWVVGTKGNPKKDGGYSGHFFQ
jgi:uncharacterized protein YndB with AHSA1/START domain